MAIYYSTMIQGDMAVLTDDEHRHCAKTMRSRAGDSISLVDGIGHMYDGVILQINKTEVTVRLQQNMTVPKPLPALHIAIAPTKNMSRFEWFLEKATEIGIAEISPILTKHSERKKINESRCQKILISAMKQSQRSWLPKLNELVKLDAFFDNISIDNQVFLAKYEHANAQLHDELQTKQSAIILIGPEGDFSESEADQILAHEAKSVNLGHHRLRTETAGIYATAIFNVKNS